MPKTKHEIDLKPYEPYGIPILKMLAGLAILSLTITAIYEIFF